jgi:hypothetical protein
LEGEQGLGIIPIRDDAMSLFGVIDIDKYDLDLSDLEGKIRSLHLPLVLCRTKSGGAHCIVFCAEPVPASYLRTRLAEWSIALGFPGVEIFPKQDALANEDDVGNWINLPYFDYEQTLRYALYDGEPLSFADFLDLAENYRMSYEQLQQVKLELLDDLSDAPPCLQVICSDKVPEGTRNDTMFALGVFAKMKYDDWQQKLDEFNHEYFDPPLGFQDMGDVVKSLTKKDYFYACKKPPLCNNCSKDVCRKREYGIGATDDGDPGVLLDSITQITTQPPIWFVSVNGVRLQVMTEDLMQQNRFAKRVMEELRIVPRPLKPHVWRDLINTLLRNVEVVQAPADAGPEGQFWHHLEQFCTQRAQAHQQDELLLGKPWTDSGRTYFRSGDLMKYLEQQRFKDFKQNQVWATLRKGKSVSHHQFQLKGSCVQCWSVAAFQEQNEAFDVPRVEDDVDY